MSLTSHISTLNDPVRLFLYNRFPNAKIPIRAMRAACEHAAIIRPDVVVPWSLLGHAIDHRIGGYFHSNTSHGIPISSLNQVWGEKGAEAYSFLRQESLIRKAEKLLVTRLRQSQGSEEWLCRYFVVLAMFEVISRSGVTPAELSIVDPLAGTDEEFLSGVPQIWVDDLCQMSWAFFDASTELLAQPATVNPTFVGSNDVGGADADLIVSGCLLEIKTAIDIKKSRPEWMYQLLGYLLLDYDNEHGIDSIGLYLVRQATYVIWSVPEFLQMMSGLESTSVAVMRSDFRSVVRSQPI